MNVFNISSENVEIHPFLGWAFFISAIISLLSSGCVVDMTKDRMKLLVISSFMVLIGYVLMVFSSPLLELIGISIIVYFTILSFINLLTIVTHESTILNRGRLLSYILFFSSLAGTSIIIITMGNILAILAFECLIFLGILYINKNYNYVETEERLKSHMNLWGLLRSQKNAITGYLTSFLVLGFVLGNGYPSEIDIIIEPITFTILALGFLILSGVLLDKMGRKWSYVGSILVLSSLIIFSGIFQELYNAIFFGIAIPVVLMGLFTFMGDFSTERNTLKYRGRIAGTFLFTLMLGIGGGIITRLLLTDLYLTNTELLYFIPSLINGLNSLLLIVLLVWLMPLPEILSAKESNWSDKLRNLYVFNKDSICLYNKNFLPEHASLELPPEDLITGGLTGILTLISEITNERKNLRIIDKDRIKIYFAYERNIIVTLISTQFLPVLFKKLEVFTKAFEREFEEELSDFRGKINPFLQRGDDLVRKYFYA